MGWFDGNSGNSYKTDDDGNFWSKEEAERAENNGDLQGLSYGGFYDKDSGTRYWPDGTKRD